MHPDIEWVNPPDAIETGTRHGRSGFQEAECIVARYGLLRSITART
jgi:hypothetical protein